jgi:hypothetical protein
MLIQSRAKPQTPAITKEEEQMCYSLEAPLTHNMLSRAAELLHTLHFPLYTISSSH